jgi:hypothetical protein
MFFSEEKNQKTFMSAPAPSLVDMAGEVGSTRRIKVFCFFSSEKKTLSFS